MLSHEERAAGIRRRMTEERRRRRRQRDRRRVAGAAAACMALLVGIGIAMPGLAGQGEGFAPPAGTASIFSGSEALRYIVIGTLAFLLGAGVTVLAFRLRRMQEDEEKKETGEDGAAE